MSLEMPIMKNCPFCGGNPLVRHNDSYAWIWIQCYNCKARGPEAVVYKCRSEEATLKAIEGWNRRFAEGSS